MLISSSDYNPYSIGITYVQVFCVLKGKSRDINATILKRTNKRPTNPFRNHGFNPRQPKLRDSSAERQNSEPVPSMASKSQTHFIFSYPTQAFTPGQRGTSP